MGLEGMLSHDPLAKWCAPYVGLLSAFLALTRASSVPWPCGTLKAGFIQSIPEG